MKQCRKKALQIEFCDTIFMVRPVTHTHTICVNRHLLLHRTNDDRNSFERKKCRLLSDEKMSFIGGQNVSRA